MKSGSAFKSISIVLILCLAGAVSLSAQNFTNLVGFDFTDGAYPYYGSLIQGTDGNFYGTTYEGGAMGQGTVFSVDAAGNLTTIYSFCTQGFPCVDGYAPENGVVQGLDGNFYGTTSQGGANGWGTIFRVSSVGRFATIYSFCGQGFPCVDGSIPYGGLVLGADGDFYGTTQQGGANGEGTLFKVTPGGTVTTLYTFCSLTACADGALPQATLIQGRDGNFYGTTPLGGVHGDGTVFKIAPTGILNTLYSFGYTDGSSPYAGLVQASNGNFYGTTSVGGSRGDGTIFQITPKGALTTVYNFCSLLHCPDGAAPYGTLIQANDGNLYGTTAAGGGTNSGTIFKFSSNGKLTALYSFCPLGYPNCTDGTTLFAGLVQGTNGILYGTTLDGGDPNCTSAFGCGTIFSLSTDLAPFVKFLPGAAKVGAKVGILGNDLTGATQVTFNGTAAEFTVQSSTLILTHVPTGATTGTIQVTLPGGNLSSNVPFYVLK